MRGWISGMVAAAVCAVSVSVVGPNAGASVARAPSDTYCTAFSDYFAASFVVQFAVGLAKSFGDEAKAREVRDEFLLVLSPKLEHITRTMAAHGPRSARSLFARQAKAYGAGVDLLRKAGVTDAQVRAIATARIDTRKDDLEKLTGTLHVKKADLAAAGKEFGKRYDDIDLAKASSKQGAAVSAAGTECGVLPDERVDCAELVRPDEASAALGGPAGRNTDKTCSYDGPPEPSGSQRSALAVDVYRSVRTFEQLTKSAKNQRVPGVGDDAVALDGFSTFSSIKTCGKTLIVKRDDDTVVVALCRPGEAEVSIETLSGLAQNLLDRLS